MAEAEERHAQRWAKKLVDLGEPVPTLPDTLGRRLKRWLNRALGTEIAIRRMEAAEEKHEAEFRDQRDRALAGEHDVKDFLREAEVEENPEEEIEEMSLFYQLQGFSPEEAQRMAERLSENPDQLVQAMAQTELGLSEHRFPSPWKSSTSAAISTAIGAFIPFVPFFFMSGIAAVVWAFAISIIAHFAVGAVKSLITLRSWWASGLEMTMVGAIEAAVTYGLGLAFGAIS